MGTYIHTDRQTDRQTVCMYTSYTSAYLYSLFASFHASYIGTHTHIYIYIRPHFYTTAEVPADPSLSALPRYNRSALKRTEVCKNPGMAQEPLMWCLQRASLFNTGSRWMIWGFIILGVPCFGVFYMRIVQCTYSLHCSSFLGLPYRILIIYLVKPNKGTTMETIGRIHCIGV